MPTLLVLLLITVAAFALASWVASRPRGAQFTPLCNVAEGYQPAVKTYATDAAISTRHLLVKLGSAATHVALCGVGDVPLGVCTDEADTAGDKVAVALFGLHQTGALGVASAGIAAGDLIVPAASGKVRTLPGATGSYYIIGRALNAPALDGDACEFVPFTPVLREVA